MKKPTKKEMDTIMTLLALSKHVINCKECAQKQADIMNHANFPTEGITKEPGPNDWSYQMWNNNKKSKDG